MMSKSRDLITDEVVSTAERIEDLENGDVFSTLDELNPLEVKAEASIDGDISEVILVLTVGGPHLELHTVTGVVHGSWGGETHRVHVDNEPVLDAISRHYTRYWNDNIIA